MARPASGSHTVADPYLDPMHSLGYLCRVNFREFSRALERLTLPKGVSAGQWRLLRVLWEKDNVTQRELSWRAGTTEATTAHTLRGMLDDGLVLRRRDKQDKRKQYVKLTAKARRLRTELMPMVVAVNESALAGVSAKDIDTTRRVLAHTYQNLCSSEPVTND